MYADLRYNLIAYKLHIRIGGGISEKDTDII